MAKSRRYSTFAQPVTDIDYQPLPRSWHAPTRGAQMSRPCQARQHSDQMICTACRLAWDVNDPEPPECLRQAASAAKVEPQSPDHPSTDRSKPMK